VIAEFKTTSISWQFRPRVLELFSRKLWDVLETRRLSTMRIMFACAVLSAVLSVAPAFAHHSFAAEYDSSKPLNIRGTVTEIEWLNPHAYIHLDVQDAAGNVTKIMVEGHPPNILHRTGWGKDTIKVNDQIQVSGWAARDGSSRMAGRQVTLPDGKKLFWGPPGQ
jgi:hypothetical protein